MTAAWPASSGGGSLPGRRSESLADVLERVLDKGVVIAGDVVVNVLDIELLTLKLRLLVASADTAREMGIDWWSGDPFLSGDARALADENRELRQRLADIEARLAELPGGETDRDTNRDGADRDADRDGGA